jgi:hypothetical protein
LLCLTGETAEKLFEKTKTDLQKSQNLLNETKRQWKQEIKVWDSERTLTLRDLESKAGEVRELSSQLFEALQIVQDTKAIEESGKLARLKTKQKVRHLFLLNFFLCYLV